MRAVVTFEAQETAWLLMVGPHDDDDQRSRQQAPKTSSLIS